MMPLVAPPSDPSGRNESGEMAHLRALRTSQPELADAADLHLALLDLQHRVRLRVSLPWIDIDGPAFAQHVREGRPILRFEQIPLEVSDLRLTIRKTAEVLHRCGALAPEDYGRAEALGRSPGLMEAAAAWYAKTGGRHAGSPVQRSSPEDEAVDQVLALAMRPFLSRCAEAFQPRPELSTWSHGYCALCGAEPDLAVIVSATSRRLVCSQCHLQWAFDATACPFCHNRDRSRVSSFATPDGQYRVFGCDQCRRYLKAFDARNASRPLFPTFDGVATLPLDAAAIQQGYTVG
jgi:FdhE protein